MSCIGKYCLKIRKGGQGEWNPLKTRLVIPRDADNPDKVLGEEGVFDTIEEARAAKTQFLEGAPGVECCIFKTIKNEEGEAEDINIDALMDDRD